jgi:hypothetical protein
MPAELREPLRHFAIDARDAKHGLWARASGLPGNSVEIQNLNDLQGKVIWPKLFRRLVPYFQEGNQDFAGLDAWLRADPRNRDDRLLLPNHELGNMHDLIAEQGHRIFLEHFPENVIVVPDDYVLPQPPVVVEPVHAGALRILAALIDPLQTPERGHETVTLINVTENAISLDGLQLADNNGKQALSGSLNAGETVRLRLSNSVRLSNTRDTISLFDANGTLIDQVSYEKRQLPPAGHSMVFK